MTATTKSESDKVNKLREDILQKFESNGNPELFHELDVALVKDSDEYIEKFLIFNDYDEKSSFKQLWEALKWRKEYGIHDLTEKSLPRECLEKSTIFFNGRDIEDRLVIIFHGKHHKKGRFKPEDLKKNLVYWLERGLRQEKGRKMVFVFDLLDSGYQNIDMDYIMTMVSTLKSYYPEILKWILVFEMPWIMNTTFQVIKKFLNRRTVEVLKFVDKKSIRKYIDEDNIPVHWGGRNSYEFQFMPETRVVENENNVMHPLASNNNSEKQENLNTNNVAIPRKVHFANNLSHTPSPIEESIITSFGNDMLQITPAETIVFQKNSENELYGNVHILNISKKPVTYKVKTTAPDKFRVRPSSGTISPLATASINVVVQKGQQFSAMSKDKFLVMCFPLPELEALTNDEIANLWKGVNAGSPEVEQHRLKCTIPANVAASIISSSSDIPSVVDTFITDTHIVASASSMAHNGTKTTGQVINTQHLQATISQLNETVNQLNNQIKSQQSLQWITIFIFVMLSIAMVYILKQEIQNSNSQYCIDNDHHQQQIHQHQAE